MKREFDIQHAWLHCKCFNRMIKERIFEGKHRGKVMWHTNFYFRGVLRSFGIITH